MIYKKLLILSFIVILLLPFVISQESVTADSTDILRNTFINEEIKTRADIKAYFDKTKNDIIKQTGQEGQRIIDENMKIFDERVNSLAQKMLIKVTVGLACVIILSMTIWTIIANKIRNVRKRAEERVNVDKELPAF